MSSFAPSHHPATPLLAAHASGALSPAIHRIIGAHVALCDRCRRTLSPLEMLGGALLEEQALEQLSPRALDEVLAAIAVERPATVPDAVKPLPAQVHDIVAPAVGQASWQNAGPGLKVLDLKLPPAATGETFQLMRIEPGYGPPRHTHGGQEFTLVLTGAFKDETGLYRPGDIAIGNEGITHRPVAEPGEVCFALAATTAPIKFKGPLGLLQRVMNLGRQ